jgi:putative Holliday junction resolvase
MLAALGKLVEEHHPEAIVLGRPRRSQGEPGTLAPMVEAFAVELSAACGVPVTLRDESLTTAAAHEKLLEAGARRRKRLASIDAAAAAVLLQAFLDDRRRGS